MTKPVKCPHCLEAIDVVHLGGLFSFQHRGTPCPPFVAWCDELLTAIVEHGALEATSVPRKPRLQ